MNDYYVKTQDVVSSLYGLYNSNQNSPINICIPKSLEPNHTDTYTICETCEELNINIIKSLLVENVIIQNGRLSNFLVLNPGDRALKLCEKLRDQRKDFILDTLVNLPEDHMVSPTKILVEEKKKELYQITLKDIVHMWMIENIINNPIVSYNALKQFSVQFEPELLSFKTMMQYLNNEDVYIVHPEREDEYKIINKINGIIEGPNTGESYIKEAKQHFYGSASDYIKPNSRHIAKNLFKMFTH